MRETNVALAAFRDTDRSLPIALLRARETVMQPIREMLAKTGISEQKWRVLRVAEEAGPVEQSVIAARACLLLPSLTRILRSMTAEGLLEKRVDAFDKRKSIVTITPKGRALLSEHADEANAIYQQMRDRFGADEMDQLLDLLERLQKTST